MIPDALLQSHGFWQDVLTGALRGYPQNPIKHPFWLDLDGSFFNMKITRRSLNSLPSSAAQFLGIRKTAEAEQESSLILCDLLMYAGESPEARQLIDLLTRIENLSQVLVWTRPTLDPHFSDLVLIELPRLGLKFAPGVDDLGVRQLFCLSHAGFFISDVRDELLQTLHVALGPFALLLENSAHELAFLVSSAPLARPKVQICPFSTLTVPHRQNQGWLRDLDPASRCFLIPVHSSRTFLQPSSLGASLCLLSLFMLHRQYVQAP